MFKQLASICACLLLAVGCVSDVAPSDDLSRSEAPVLPADRAIRSSTNDPVERGCELPKRILMRLWRGHDQQASDDVTIVPREPNYWGSFTRTSHTGPWDYLQRVPLVFYGPGRIVASDRPLKTPANLTDVYPTVGELVGVHLPDRPGSKVLESALEPDAVGAPKLILVIMWDGVGRNVLDRWPNRWPNLARLERDGTSFYDATVGSSPSITPTTHANLSTGTWPRNHGVIAIDYRDPSGGISQPFPDGDPALLRLTTFGDEIDQAFGNASQVGMIAWQIQQPGQESVSAQSWHQGMLGHGTSIDGGDADHLALIGHGGKITSNEDYFELPGYLERPRVLDHEAERIDLSDGELDGKWLGGAILRTHDNPAWIAYQNQMLLELMRTEGYGADDVPDLLFTNFKVTDIVGHQKTIDSREMALSLEAQDRALGELLRYLDDEVGDYAVVLSADHGHTHDATESGAWPIVPSEFAGDIERHFEVGKDRKLVVNTSASGLFLDHDVLDELHLTSVDVAKFLNGYTVEENWTGGELPDGYSERADEQVLSAAFAKTQMDEIMLCAFGSRRPPADLDA